MSLGGLDMECAWLWTLKWTLGGIGLGFLLGVIVTWLFRGRVIGSAG